MLRKRLADGERIDHVRRDLMRKSGTLLAACAVVTVLPHRGAATPERMQSAILAATGGAPLRDGRVMLDIPPLVENGNTVPCTVTVDSPMTATDFVRRVHVFNEKNPQPQVITARLGPRAGRASVGFRMRLADTQTVVAIAEMSDGSFWTTRSDVVVTLGACLEDLI